MKIRILFPLIIFFTSWSLLAQDVALPDLKSRVTDKTGTLSSGEINSLNRKLTSFEESKGSQVIVVLIPTTGEETIEQYTIRLAEAWKIGREGVDDGVIMLFAMDDRKMRIEVGYGLEGALTDALSKRIISNVITPEFRSGHFYKGIDSGVDVVLSAVSGEELPPAAVKQETASNDGGSGRFMVVLFVFGIIGLAVLKAILQKSMGKSKAVGVVSVIVFILGWIFMGIFLSIFITAVVSIFMAVPSGGGRGGRGGGGMYWGGGGGFSGGGGFGGGGGFSGGGGGFGGGGASGGW